MGGYRGRAVGDRGSGVAERCRFRRRCFDFGDLPPASLPRARSPIPDPRAPRAGLEIIFRPDPTIWDGRFANNGWLQELPKPLTKITWDPTAWVSPRLAEQQHLRDGDIIELKYRGNTAKLPVAIVPGHPDGAVTAFFGYGRQVTGRVGTSADEVARRDSTSTACAPPTRCGSAADSRSRRPGDRFVIARTQEHHLMEEPRAGARRDLRGVPQGPGSHRAPGREGAEDPDDDSRVGIQGPQVGDVDRPDVLHRLRRLHDRLRLREQHPGRRQGSGPPRTRDALDPRRSLFLGRSRQSEDRTTSRCRACSAKTRPASSSARSAPRRTAPKA